MGATGYFEKPVDFDALRASLAKVRGQTHVPRTEIRLQLRVELKLSGKDIQGKEFKQTTFTENVSVSAFLCSCAAELAKDSIGIFHAVWFPVCGENGRVDSEVAQSPSGGGPGCQCRYATNHGGFWLTLRACLAHSKRPGRKTIHDHNSSRAHEARPGEPDGRNQFAFGTQRSSLDR